MDKKIIKSEELEQSMPPTALLPPLMTKGAVITKVELSARDKAHVFMEEAQAQSARIQTEANKILSQVKTEMEKAKQKGYQEGKEAGLAEFTEEALRVRNLKETFFANAESEVIKLVMAIAEKVVGKLVEENKEAVRSIVRQALERALGDRIVVRMNPEDMKRLKPEDLQFKNLLDRTKHLRFKEDEAIQKGGCVVETEVGTIDAQLETQLKAIRKALGI